MRNHQQKQILELLETLREAQSAGLYADCQEGAIQIGEFIESIEGEGTRTVELLEEYCELLYKASIGEISEKQLRKHLIQIENCVRSELKQSRIEMVFLPYKASMSDSLESIYLAAKNDPDCDAFWIPIPYYELTSSGSLGKMYYEGADNYNENINCTDWQKYDLEARHPDVVFIHYPYDDNASNATIHPSFYSKRLREHCELLIYVPYFISQNGLVDEYCAYLPGVLYAHHVIVESEAVRQSYIGHYTKFDKEHNLKEHFGKAEEKFIALGSPKFDKVLNSRREDYELPAEWERLIYNPDGTRKKVILYNTHMFAWINGGEAYFKKILSVFDVFRNRDDVVLWWRPHPNTELNFRTKRPQWLNAYKMIVDEYIRGGWGIYDDTVELHRAIVRSDIYFGDASSVVEMYQHTSKPIMIQSIDYVETDLENCLLRFSCLADAEGFYWFVAQYYNALFKMDKQTLITEYIGCFPNEKKNAINLFTDIFAWEGKLYFAPYTAEHMATYNIATNEFSIIDTPTDFEGKGSFGYFYQYNSFLYCIPSCYPAIVRINLNTNEAEFLTNWVQQLRHYTHSFDDTLFGRGIIVDAQTLLIPFLDADMLLEVNMESGTQSIIKLDSSNGGSSVICQDGEDLWLFSSEHARITRLNRHSNTCVTYDQFPQGFTPKRFNFLLCRYSEGYIHAYRHTANMSVKISTETGDITTGDEIVDGSDPVWYGGFLGESIYMLESKTSRLTITDKNTGEKNVWSIMINSSDRLRLERDYCEIQRELTLNTLVDFLDYLPKTDVQNILSPIESAGKEIYHFAKGIVLNERIH